MDVKVQEMHTELDGVRLVHGQDCAEFADIAGPSAVAVASTSSLIYCVIKRVLLYRTVSIKLQNMPHCF